MSDLGKILIADDEETFLHSTADLLRQEGFECDCAADGPTAIQMLRQSCYNLVIADIKMPGNSELELVRELPRLAQGIPIILVTGYPSLRTAMQSVQLPVSAYLTKPVEFNELKQYVRTAIQGSHFFFSIQNTRRRLEDSCQQLSNIEELFKSSPRPKTTNFSAFIELTFMNIFGALSDLKHLTNAMGMGDVKEQACHLLDCPKLHTLSGAVADAIEVLEHTKQSFKSKELGELRKKLQNLMRGETKAEN